MHLVDHPSRLLFFTGKGGVGKTSLACATAVALADRGKRVLLVSTDPASNLGQVFGFTIGEAEPTPVPGVPRLSALNINPEAAARAYRDRLVGPVRGLLPTDTVQAMEEQLSGACTTEIAAFDEFTGLLGDPGTEQDYDHVIFDTAPTGHTLRLLKLPTAWTSFLDSTESGASCLGPLSGLEKQRHQYADAVATLADGDVTTVVLVARAQQAALGEAARTSHELGLLGIRNQRLVVNGVMPDGDSPDPVAIAVRDRERKALATIPAAIADLPREIVALQPCNMVGAASLRAMLARGPSATGHTEPPAARLTPRPSRSLGILIDQIEQDGHGLVMVLGKGGVGKTTIAAAIAVELATRGHDVHLTTTDPAAHLAMTVESDLPHLTVSRIDPHDERDRYRRHVLETKGDALDAAGKALLEEDLRSPCTEEIAVFQAFSRVIQESRKSFVVVDTAPTGHTLLLLDATGAYHRDVVRHMNPDLHVVTPMMRLQDPRETKMVIVTLPETTPVLEAEALEADLRRAGIEPWAWVVNASIAAAGPTDPLLVARAAAEVPHIEGMEQRHRRIAVIPWLTHEPIGSRRLRDLVGT
jgi:arsenite-transporting ATPase